MRFVLDHDVDVAVCGVLASGWHQCWRAPAHLASLGKDDEISVYAFSKEAVVISHDVEFASRRVVNPYGQHVRLRCEQYEAVAVVEMHLESLIEWLEIHNPGVFEVRRSGVVVRYPREEP